MKPIDVLQEKYDSMLPEGYEFLSEEDDIERLDFLDKKADQYETSCNSLLDQMSEILSKIGGSVSRDERLALRIRLANVGEEIQQLRPLTVDEIVERDAIMQKMKGDE
jgi:hypothetical protein